MKKLSFLFTVLALLLSHVMCAVVAYDYSYMRHSTELHSAPAEVALLGAIPFLIGIAVCLILSKAFKSKQ